MSFSTLEDHDPFMHIPTPESASMPPENAKDVFVSLDALRIDPRMSDAPAINKVLVTLPVRKPSKEKFVRTHPDVEKFGIDTLVLELKDEGEIYLIDPTLRAELAGESTVHIKRLRLSVDRQGDYFIWPARLPDRDGTSNTWNESSLEAQHLAEHKWVRITANRNLGAYDIHEAAIDHDPSWPEQPYNELLRIAFKGRVIDRWEHPVLRKLRGEL